MVHNKGIIIKTIQDYYYPKKNSVDQLEEDNDKIKIKGNDPDKVDHILAESDKMLGYDKPPDLEVIYVGSFVSFYLPWTNSKIGIGNNMFGHICLRYTYQGKQYVTNIHPKGNTQTGGMVASYSPSQYFVDSDMITPQKGVSHREMYGMRHYNVSEEQIGIIHNYLMYLSKNEGIEFKFSGGPDLLLNKLKKWGLIDTMERGNCALWTAKSLKLANLTSWGSTFPKKIIINDFEKKTPDSFMVRYKSQEKNPERVYGKDGTPVDIANLTVTTNVLYSNLPKFCSLTIDFNNLNKECHIPITINKNPVQPNKFRYYATQASTYVITGYIGYKVYRNRTTISTKFMNVINKVIKFRL